MNVVMKVKPEPPVLPDPEPGMVFWWDEEPFMVVRPDSNMEVKDLYFSISVYAVNLNTGLVTKFTDQYTWPDMAGASWEEFTFIGRATDIHITAEEV